jgi:hypothetical protein
MGPYRISHHPLCDNFSEHVYIFRRQRVCRGCVMQYTGMTFAFFLIIFDLIFQILFSTWSDFQFGIFLYFLVFPTILTSFFLKNRILKDLARFMLGIAFTLAFFLLLITPSWFVKGFILLNFLPGYFYLQKRREIKNERICVECQEYEHRPYCSGYQTYQDRESIFLSQASKGGIQDPFALSPESLDD